MGDLHVVLTLLEDRVSDFFGAAREEDIADSDTYDSNPSSITPSTRPFSVTRVTVDYICCENLLVHFNG